jgi:hypothetical protein
MLRHRLSVTHMDVEDNPGRLRSLGCHITATVDQ